MKLLVYQQQQQQQQALLHEYNKVFQYCKSHVNLIINYLIN